MDEADPPAILRSEVLKIIDVVLDSSISIDFLGESELLLETEVVRVLQKGLKRAEANLKEQKRILDEKVKAAAAAAAAEKAAAEAKAKAEAEAKAKAEEAARREARAAAEAARREAAALAAAQAEAKAKADAEARAAEEAARRKAAAKAKAERDAAAAAAKAEREAAKAIEAANAAVAKARAKQEAEAKAAEKAEAHARNKAEKEAARQREREVREKEKEVERQVREAREKEKQEEKQRERQAAAERKAAAERLKVEAEKAREEAAAIARAQMEAEKAAKAAEEAARKEAAAKVKADAAAKAKEEKKIMEAEKAARAAEEAAKREAAIRAKVEAQAAAKAEKMEKDAVAAAQQASSSSPRLLSSAGTISQQRLERASQRMGSSSLFGFLKASSNSDEISEDGVNIDGVYSAEGPSKSKCCSSAQTSSATAPSESTSWISRPEEVEGPGKSLYLRLREAAEAGKLLEIDAAMLAGAPIDAQDHSGMTALHWALMGEAEGGKPLATALLGAGASVRSVTKLGFTPLHTACIAGCSTSAVEALLRESKMDVNAPDNENGTPLHWAALNGRVEIVELLLAAGANTDAISRRGTPADWVPIRRHPELEKKLRALQSDPTRRRARKKRDSHD